MIQLRGRKMIVSPDERIIGSSGDNNAAIRVFSIDRNYYADTDLSSLSFRLDIKYDDGTTNTDMLEKIVTENEIHLTWTILGNDVAKSGTIFLQIRAHDYAGTLKWNSFICPFYVEPVIGSASEYTGTLTELERLETIIDAKINVLDISMDDMQKTGEQLEKLVNDVQSELDEFHILVARAEDAALSAVESAQSAGEREVNAHSSSASAGESASIASAAAVSATESAESAKNAELNAAEDRQLAEESAISAGTSAQEANNSAAVAVQSAANANTEAIAAKLSEENAKTSENNAKESETNAKASEDNVAEAEERIMAIEVDAQGAEAQRKQNEIERQQHELGREEAEALRQLHTNEAIQNMDDFVADVEGKLENGDFDGSSYVSRGDWEFGKEYTHDSKSIDTVFFNGSSYSCVVSHTSSPSNQPPNNTYWQLVAQKGADGLGAGDMMVSTYDPTGKASDIFAYADKKATTKEWTATLTADGWAPIVNGDHISYTQTRLLSGMYSEYRPIIDIIPSVSDDPSKIELSIQEIKEWGYIDFVSSGLNCIYVGCLKKKPSIDLNIVVKVVI